LKSTSRKKAKFQLNKDSDGNIIYPLKINNTLTLLNLGKICLLPGYHSEHNLFPVGFKSKRVYASMNTLGEKAIYTCEIFKGKNNKPVYTICSSEEPDITITRFSCTGCWVYVCKRVNNLKEVKKAKVTISGTERFGLLENNVVRLLEHLTNAEKCANYNFK